QASSSVFIRCRFSSALTCHLSSPSPRAAITDADRVVDFDGVPAQQVEPLEPLAGQMFDGEPRGLVNNTWQILVFHARSGMRGSQLRARCGVEEDRVPVVRALV